MTSFTGLTTACLLDYSRRASLHDLDVMASFVGVTAATALGWVAKESTKSRDKEVALPKGRTLLKLRYFLELTGYTVQELEDLPGPARQLAMAIALDVISVARAVTKMEYNDEGAIYRQTLQPMRGLGPKREGYLNELVAESEQACLEKAAEWRERLASRPVVSQEVTSKVAPTSAVDTAMLSVVLSSGLQMVAAALERLEESPSDERDRVLHTLLTSVGKTRIETMALYLGELV